MIIKKKFCFEAAHWLPDHPGLCKRLHGHSYHGEIAIEGEIDKTTNMVMDYGDLKKIVQAQILDKYDHTCLNDFLRQPTAEAIAMDIFYRIQPKLPLHIHLVEVIIRETDTSEAVYRGD